MKVDDTVRYRGRRWRVHGFTRASSMEQYVILKDPKNGDLRTVPLAETEPMDLDVPEGEDSE